ncbi:phage head morphogenesis protein [Lactobacillus sp. CBA3605]|uniref:minor capsid protein n=1 Tax=Lactobacillus sp. CBA3605 TaxID=2099788 RepID=UPI000CFE0EE3|nr:minor capsid protein [Lactobacillus sp. CBA3605]AVK60539.1 phage head morphogenesis protein [Lactobacillus sp. CBA3605]
MVKERKLNYWQLRAIYNEQHAHDAANDVIPTITRAYIRAQNYLTGEVNQIYRRYFTDGDYTEAEAEQILNTVVSPTELVTLRALADNVSDKESKKQVNKYLSSMAAKGRITRLEELKAKSYIAAKQAASIELDKSTDLYTKVIQDAFDQVNADGLLNNFHKDVEVSKQPNGSRKPEKHIIADSKTGKEITTVDVQPDPAINGFKELSGKYVRAALDTPWYGRNFSQRIWRNTDKLAERVSELFTAQQMSGMRQRDMAKALADEFGASIAQAKTLIRTEANYFHNKTNLDSWKQRGVKQYKLIAVLDMRTSRFCRDIDGEILDVSRAVMGVTFPPFHPNCRTIAVIYLPNSRYKLKRTANDPIDGKLIKLKPDATYTDWEKALVMKHGDHGVSVFKQRAANYRSDKDLYGKMSEFISDEHMPAFDNFQEMKYNDDRDWRNLHVDYLRQHRLKNNPKLSLPNQDNLNLPNAKFEKYLFNLENKRGYEKGKLITKELGFDKTNYSSLQNLITDNVGKYPAVDKGYNGHGELYQQDMIIYNKHNRPINLRVTWINEHGETRMTTALIKEVKHENS